MRISLSLSLAILTLQLAASTVSAQPYIAPPRAPDMMNPGYYYNTTNGTIYGPNYYVRPCAPPFQGMLLGPNGNPYQGPGCAGNTGGQMGGQMGSVAFPAHLFSRSPRDFFMIETDPRASPFGFGGFGSMGRTGNDYP